MKGTRCRLRLIKQNVVGIHVDNGTLNTTKSNTVVVRVLPFRQFTCRWQGSHLMKTSNIETYVCKYMELYYAL